MAIADIRKACIATADGHPLLFLDGYDDAILGVGLQHTKEPFVIYDQAQILEICTKELGIPEDEAWEYLEFNVFTAWMGPQTPIFMVPPDYDYDEFCATSDCEEPE